MKKHVFILLVLVLAALAITAQTCSQAKSEAYSTLESHWEYDGFTGQSLYVTTFTSDGAFWRMAQPYIGPYGYGYFGSSVFVSNDGRWFDPNERNPKIHSGTPPQKAGRR